MLYCLRVLYLFDLLLVVLFLLPIVSMIYFVHLVFVYVVSMIDPFHILFVVFFSALSTSHCSHDCLFSAALSLAVRARSSQSLPSVSLLDF